MFFALKLSLGTSLDSLLISELTAAVKCLLSFLLNSYSCDISVVITLCITQYYIKHLRGILRHTTVQNDAASVHKKKEKLPPKP